MVENLLKLSYLHRFLIVLHHIWTHCLMLAILYSKRVSNHFDENYRLGNSFCLDGKRVFLRGYIFLSAILQKNSLKIAKTVLTYDRKHIKPLIKRIKTKPEKNTPV